MYILTIRQRCKVKIAVVLFEESHDRGRYNIFYNIMCFENFHSMQICSTLANIKPVSKLQQIFIESLNEFLYN